MFPTFQFPDISFLRFLLPFVPAIVFGLNFALREYFYEFLERSLDTNSKVLRIVGELLGLADASVKAWGVYLLSTLPTLLVVFPQTIPLGVFIGASTAILLGLRYWIYPSAVRSMSTKSPVDDIIFIGDIAIRALGVYQLLVVM